MQIGIVFCVGNSVFFVPLDTHLIQINCPKMRLSPMPIFQSVDCRTETHDKNVIYFSFVLFPDGASSQKNPDENSISIRAESRNSWSEREKSLCVWWKLCVLIAYSTGKPNRDAHGFMRYYLPWYNKRCTKRSVNADTFDSINQNHCVFVSLLSLLWRGRVCHIAIECNRVLEMHQLI